MEWFGLALISAIFSAIAAVSEKKTLNFLEPLDFSFKVSFITLLFTIPFFFGIDFNKITSLNLTVLFFKTMLSAGAFYCVMISMKNLEISKALPLLALSPGIVGFFGTLLIGDHLHYIQWAGIILMITGTYVLEITKDTENFMQPLKALFSMQKYRFVFLALALFTVSSLLDRLLLNQFKMPPYTFMAFQQVFYVIFFTGLVLLKKKNIRELSLKTNKQIITLIILISIFTVIYRYTQAEAVKLAPVAIVLSVKRLSVLMAIIIGGKLFKEDNLIKRIIATLIILTGTTILMIS